MDIDSESAVREDEVDVEVQTEMADSVDVEEDDSEPAEVTVEEASDDQPSHQKTPSRVQTHHPIHPPDAYTSREYESEWAGLHLRK